MSHPVPFDFEEQRLQRQAEWLRRRSVESAFKDLMLATTAMDASLDALAEACPNVTAFGAITSGRSRGVFVLTASELGDHYSPLAVERMKTWARIFGHLPPELRDAFEAELRNIPRK